MNPPGILLDTGPIVALLSANDKKTLALTAFQAPDWMRPTLVSIANAVTAYIDG